MENVVDPKNIYQDLFVCDSILKHVNRSVHLYDCLIFESGESRVKNVYLSGNEFMPEITFEQLKILQNVLMSYKVRAFQKFIEDAEKRDLVAWKKGGRNERIKGAA